jgi:hypothetical protein
MNRQLLYDYLFTFAMVWMAIAAGISARKGNWLAAAIYCGALSIIVICDALL